VHLVGIIIGNHNVTQSVHNLRCCLLSNFQTCFDFYEHSEARRGRRKKERMKEVKNEIKKEGMKVEVAKKAIFCYRKA